MRTRSYIYSSAASHCATLALIVCDHGQRVALLNRLSHTAIDGERRAAQKTCGFLSPPLPLPPLNLGQCTRIQILTLEVSSAFELPGFFG